MPIAENTEKRLVLNSGSTTLTLDKSEGHATLQRKVLFWRAKPLTMPLVAVTGVSIDAGVDRASGVEVCNAMIVFNTGLAWALPAADKNEAQAFAAAMRSFLGLAG